MERREFLKAAGAGAVGMGMGSTALLGQTTGTKARRKMVVRADDIGMSNVCNIGTFEAIEHGVVTVAAVMLADPGTVDALERLRAYPWLSIDWHMHMWGTPVSPAERVPSLIEKSGPFAGRFRTDLGNAPDVSQEEAVTEMRAQLLRCAKILGKVPDTGMGGNERSPWGRAVEQINQEFAIVYNFASEPATPAAYMKHVHEAQARGEEWAKYYPKDARPATQADPRWAGRKIVTAGGQAAYVDLLTDSIASVEKNYDPVLFYTEDRAGILRYPPDVITWQAWHPGYVDYTVYRLGERVNRARAQQFVVGRVQDVHALVDPRFKDWIQANGIELVNFRDALYGTEEYQNHLKAAGSELCMI